MTASVPSTTAAYRKRWLLDRELGRARMHDSTPVRAHINSLLMSGLSVRGIADRARVAATVISRLHRGQQPKVRTATARKILAVSAEKAYERPNADGFVPNCGARRRIQAMLALGWRHEDITAAMGTRTTSALVLNQVGGWIARATHDAVAAAYSELADRPGPSDHTRRRAAKAGYAPPAAWDDEDAMDDPLADLPDGYGIRYDQCHRPGCTAAPLAHDLCSEHYHEDRRAPQRHRGADLDEWAHLVRLGESPETAASRCGVTLASIETAVRTAGRTDLQRLLQEVA